ncbi:MAG: alkaline phosphatase D family protein [Nitrospira sp.]|nr:alkaline phosphatase D family protein [Nitrospira sp.]
MTLILLDGRSYRSRNDAPDEPGKTLLGPRQLAWLKDALVHSRATWKVVSSDVPLSVPTGSKFGRDAWADGNTPEPASRTGFEHELLDLMRFLDDHQVKNVVFLAADVHFAAQLRYSVDLNGDGNPLIIHELMAGPLAAMRRQPPMPDFDSTLGPAVLYAEGDLFNFGYVTIDRQADGVPHLIAQVYDDSGELRPGATLHLKPQ